MIWMRFAITLFLISELVLKSEVPICVFCLTVDRLEIHIVPSLFKCLALHYKRACELQSNNNAQGKSNMQHLQQGLQMNFWVFFNILSSFFTYGSFL